MEKLFSMKWKSSTQPRKQRKYVKNAPLHIKSKMLGCHLSKELRTKYNRRNVRVIKGDKVKVLVGQFRGKSGRIEEVDVKKMKAKIAGIEIIKKDGNKVLYPIHVSNLEIAELNLNDKKRKALIERKMEKKK